MSITSTVDDDFNFLTQRSFLGVVDHRTDTTATLT